MRDRSTFAMSFASALATEVFVDLSRTFLMAVQSGCAENQPPHSAEGTVRLDDIYHLHRLAHGVHAAVAQALGGSMSSGHRGMLQRAMWATAAVAVINLVLVHVAFVSPSSQLLSAHELSQAVYEAGGWKDLAEAGERTQSWSPTIVRLEVGNVSWPQQWLRPYIFWLQEVSQDVRRPMENSSNQSQDSANQSQDNATAAQDASEVPWKGFRDVATRRLAGLAVSAYDFLFPVPRYEVTYGADSASWLEVQSPLARAALGVQIVDLNLSATDDRYFGPPWAQELLSVLRLYDVYVLHALPLYFARVHGCGAGPGRLHALVVNKQHRGMDLSPISQHISMACRPGWRSLRWLTWSVFTACLALPLVLVGAMLLSAFLRRLAVLTVRLQVYSSCTLRQMRRYPFIAEPMRRINCYSSNELLELWTAWASLAALAVWMLAEAAQLGFFWAGLLLCYALAEYWGIVHVRTTQSRWIFPRTMFLLHGGTLAYALRWPACPSWMLLWALATSQLSFMFTLLCHFDCFATLPEQPPHRLLFRSTMMPAQQLSRHLPASRGMSPPAEVDKARRPTGTWTAARQTMQAAQDVQPALD